jgi:ABC-type branched-subunit amino acid transport system ATPase component
VTLDARDVKVTFGGVVALAGVNITVHPGEVVGLIGPNGAGKTALLDVISGINRRYAGSIQLGGSPIDGWSAHRRARAGLGRSFQGLDLFEDQSVWDNFRTASDHRQSFSYVSDLVLPANKPLPAAAVTAINELGLRDALDRWPGELSHGRRRLVAIARALATAPSVLLLDEPAAGLDDRAVANLGTLIRRLADDWGLGILLVEHDMPLVMRTCDQITALHFGHQIAQGAPDLVRDDRALIAAYLGEPEASVRSSVATKPDAERQLI